MPKAAPAAPPTRAIPRVSAKTTPASKSKTKSAAQLSSKPAASLRLPPGALLGAHTSTSGGVAQSVPRALGCGFTAAQIFVKNNKQWFANPLSDLEIAQFQEARKESGLYVFAHNSYLINLGNPNPELFATSLRSMIAELQRAESLGLPFIVMHPGSHGGAGEEAGLRRIVQGLDEVVKATPSVQCRMALEVTAGQGKSLGYCIEHLAFLMKNVSDRKRFGCCLDTAHLYAAGYNIRTREGYEETMGRVEKLLGKRNVLGLHLNDSKVPLGSRVDRHAHLGLGEIGLDCFRWIVEDPRWASIPKILETPKSEDMHEDVENLAKLAPYLRFP